MDYGLDSYTVLAIAFIIIFILILIIRHAVKRSAEKAEHDGEPSSGKPSEFATRDGSAGPKGGFSTPGAVGSSPSKKDDATKKVPKSGKSRIHVTTKASTGRPVKMSGEKTAEEADYKMLLIWEGLPSGVRECPVCGAEIASGVTVCQACGS